MDSSDSACKLLRKAKFSLKCSGRDALGIATALLNTTLLCIKQYNNYGFYDVCGGLPGEHHLCDRGIVLLCDLLQSWIMKYRVVISRVLAAQPLSPEGRVCPDRVE